MSSRSEYITLYLADSADSGDGFATWNLSRGIWSHLFETESRCLVSLVRSQLSATVTESFGLVVGLQTGGPNSYSTNSRQPLAIMDVNVGYVDSANDTSVYFKSTNPESIKISQTAHPDQIQLLFYSLDGTTYDITGLDGCFILQFDY